jgi:uncharacterized protein YjiS (DUF1127 family)
MLQCSDLLPHGMKAVQQKEVTAMGHPTYTAFEHPQMFVLDVLQQTIISFTTWRAERRERARISRELATYTDLELVDLGIQSADIPAIINGTYTR